MTLTQKAMVAVGLLLLAGGVALAFASTRADLTPFVCPFCGDNHFPTHPMKVCVRADIGLALGSTGLVLLVAVMGKRLFTTRDKDKAM